MIYYCLHLKLYCHFLQGVWKLSTRNLFLFRLHFNASFTCLAFCPCRAFAFAGLWTLEDFEKIAGTCRVALSGSWGCNALHTALFLFCDEATHKALSIVRLNCPCCYLLLSHWGCLRSHAIAGQPNSNGLHTLLLGIAARGGLQVSVVAVGLVIVADSCVLHDSLEIICGQASCVYSILFSRLEILWWINHRRFSYSFCC